MSYQDYTIKKIIEAEKKRQREQINLIASENLCYPEIKQLLKSSLCNKYAEGIPGKRFYQGCSFVDEIELLAIERAKELFKAESANVQAHCGSTANLIAYQSLVQPGEKILSMDLLAGGHLSHGYQKHISHKIYQFIQYGVNPITFRIDYNMIEDIIKKEHPRLLVSGGSAYSRIIDYKTLFEIAHRYNCFHMVDMAHIAGLVAAEVIPSPVPYADIITSTTHKTLRGPRGAFILSKKEFEQKINQAVMPGFQGGPFMHIIAAKALLFNLAKEEKYKRYQKNVLKNASLMAEMFEKESISIISGGTDTHLFLVNTIEYKKTGKDIAESLEQENIIVNKNALPYDTLSPLITSGIRIGTPFITAQKKSKREIIEITKKIIKVIKT